MEADYYFNIGYSIVGLLDFVAVSIVVSSFVVVLSTILSVVAVAKDNSTCFGPQEDGLEPAVKSKKL